MYVLLNKQALEGDRAKRRRREMCRDTQVGKLKIHTGLWPRFWGYFTLVQCCHEQTERVTLLGLCGQTLRRNYNSFLCGEKLVLC